MSQEGFFAHLGSEGEMMHKLEALFYECEEIIYKTLKQAIVESDMLELLAREGAQRLALQIVEKTARNMMAKKIEFKTIEEAAKFIRQKQNKCYCRYIRMRKGMNAPWQHNYRFYTEDRTTIDVYSPSIEPKEAERILLQYFPKPVLDFKKAEPCG